MMLHQSAPEATQLRVGALRPLKAGTVLGKGLQPGHCHPQANGPEHLERGGSAPCPFCPSTCRVERGPLPHTAWVPQAMQCPASSTSYQCLGQLAPVQNQTVNGLEATELEGRSDNHIPYSEEKVRGHDHWQHFRHEKVADTHT